MKAIVQDRYGSADALELATVDQPAPEDDELLSGCMRPGSTPASGTS
jgi:NADPH:quinone reductase-like Zn-dependent oxidoreductase